MIARLLVIPALLAAACASSPAPAPAQPAPAAAAAAAVPATTHPTAAAASPARPRVAASGAAARPRVKERFDMRVRSDFFAGFEGDMARFDKAMAYCEKVLAKNPAHPQALVWHGAGLLFRSGQAFQRGDRARGMTLWNQGLAQMNRAVALAPNSVGVRIPRGAALFGAAPYLPPAMARPLLKKAVGDYERTFALQSAYFDHLPMHARGELLYGLADGWDRLGNHHKAEHYYQQLLAQGKGTRYGKRARAWLGGHPEPAQTAETCNKGCHAR